MNDQTHLNEFGGNRKSHKKPYLKIAIALLVVATLVAAIIFFITGGFTDQNDPKVIAEKVGKHILIDTNEEPTVSTVDKASDLSAQPFFKNVVNGDKILIYPRAARIIIYRPSDDRLINVGPIVDDSLQTGENASSTDNINDSITD